MTTYNPLIPQSNNLISNSQGQILGNFTQLNTQFAVDHNAFNTGSGNGNGHHKQVTFDNAPSAPTITGTMSAVYPQDVSGVQQLFFKNAVQAIQLTGAVTLATPGTITIAGGLILKWGSFSISSTSGTANYSTAFPNAVWAVVAMPNNIASGNVAKSVCAITSQSTSSFTAVRDNTSGTANYTYIAVGH